MVIWRLRFWTPVPHDLVQVVHAEKVLVAQWTGHRPWSHVRVSAAWAQALPPHEDAVVVERLRFCEPLPQLLVQEDHEDQALWAQLTLMFVCAVLTVLPEQAAPPQDADGLLQLRYCLRQRSPLLSQVVQLDQSP